MQTSEYCASSVEQPQLIYTIIDNHEPHAYVHSSNLSQKLKATAQAHTSKPRTTFQQFVTNFVAPWYVHSDQLMKPTTQAPWCINGNK